MRFRLVAVIALAMGSGCSTDFTNALVNVDQSDGTIRIAISGREEPPCPELEYETPIWIAGMGGSVYEYGGEATDPDISYGYCDAVEVHAYDVAIGGPIEVEVESTTQPMRFAAQWERMEYTTEDDLGAAMRDRTSFEVRWTPLDAAVPELSIYGESAELETRAELMGSEAGRATFVFTGPMPAVAWSIVFRGVLDRPAALCEGLEECRFHGELFADLAGTFPAP
jgi:hypothetical protein